MLSFLINHIRLRLLMRACGYRLLRLLLLLLAALPAFFIYGLILPSENLKAQQTSQETGEDVRPLVPGEVIRRDMKGGEVHLYRLSLASRQYMHVVVEQEGIDVSVSISDPEGLLLVEMDSPNSLRGPESGSAVAQQAGSYIIKVSSDKTQPTGGYELRVEPLREASAADEKRVHAERILMEAQRLRRQGTAESKAQAIEKAESALDLWREIGDAREEGYTLCTLGRTYKALGKLPEAIQYLDQSLTRLKEIQDVPGQAFVLNEMGAANRDLGNPLQALEDYDHALELRNSIGDQWGQAQLHNNIGYVYSNIGQQQKAIENLELALPMWRAIGVRSMEMNTLNNIAKAYADMGYMTDASFKFKEVLSFCRETGDRRLEPYVLNSLGMIYQTLAEPQEALKQYEDALKLFGEMKNEEGEKGQAIVLDNTGMVYAELGDAESALENFQEAFKFRQRLNEPGGTAVTLSNIGYAQTLLENQQDALKSLNLALPLSRESHNRAFEAYTLVRVGEAYAQQNEPRKALDFYQQALDIQRELQDRRGQAITLDHIGRAYALLGQSSKALDSYSEALRNWVGVGDKQGQALSLYGTARIERDLNNLPAARDKIEEAIKIVEALRYKPTSHQLRMTYFAGKQDFYALDVDVKMRLSELNHSEADAEAALYANERAHARDLLDLLSEAHIDLNKEMSPLEAEKNHRLEQEINTLTQNWFRLRSLKRAEDAAAVEARRKAAIDEQEKFLTAIRNAHPASARIREPKITEPGEIQQLLDDDTILLEYAFNEERVYLWAVTRSGITSYSLPGRAEIERVAERLRRMLTASEPPKSGESDLQYLNRMKASAAQYQNVALDLSRMTLGPVASQLGSKRLVIVADGALQYIPFEALPVPTASDRTPSASPAQAYIPLLAQHEIVYQPSASTLALLRSMPRQHAAKTKTVAVIADPVFDSNDKRVLASIKGRNSAPAPNSLPGELRRALRDVGDVGTGGAGFRLDRLEYSAREAKSITDAAPPGSWMKAMNFQANRATAKSQDLMQYSIVHFATHSILNDRHPELSGMVLSMVNEKGEPQDGYLRLGDIYNLDLPVDLVVLSACRSGIGKPVRGEGLIGLTRGFMYAGAQRIVASLWNVEDEATSELMRRFYRLMLEQKLPASAALRKAKLEMMARVKWHNPYSWAGFVIQGDWK
jgi:CHAT domain-containing protein/predicted negative regulator of RcsB-dependent stress response